MYGTKNLLQEYCQKNQYPLPKYITDRIGGDDHKPIFKSVCYIFDKTYEATGNSKKDAEKIVATIIFDEIHKIHKIHEIDKIDKKDKTENKISTDSKNINPHNINPQNINPQNINPQKDIKGKIMRNQKVNDIYNINYDKYKNVILADGENVNLDMSIIDDRTVVIFFVAKNTTKDIVFRLQEKYENCYVFISEAVGKDAADHLLTFTMGRLTEFNKNSKIKYYILTKDHYGEFLEKFTNNCKFICSVEELYKFK